MNQKYLADNNQLKRTDLCLVGTNKACKSWMENNGLKKVMVASTIERALSLRPKFFLLIPSIPPNDAKKIINRLLDINCIHISESSFIEACKSIKL